ncbi:TPA: IS1595 family transposase [Haemophilus influenzae]|uniref:IS1595 family transposase n=1 Tax=Haemophilus influenzae TaxID=727 RepID=UPI001F227CFD|nr:IS1595 family transposase [Haemophilus influenzae]MCK9061080.1 IS1595 family transposase [Haemophilus influenzae]MCK9079323.1 IS1595 family transposase [Haemophilus influenzae]
MVQHYMLSSKSKNLNLKQIFRLSEDEVFQLLKTNRWGNSNDITDVVCPHCGIRHNAYFLQSHKRWCCKHCQRHFYITTNTMFSFHKLPLVNILATTLLMVNSSKGISAIDVSRLLHLNYKTAFVLCGKVSEALFKTRDLSSLSGEVHEDGMWINFTLRPTNFRKNNYKKRQQADEKGQKFPKFRPTKRCLFVMTQRAANDSNIWGANRTIVAMDYTENADTVFALKQRLAKAGSDIMCDENPAYNNLNFHYNRWSVNHQEAYSAKGVNNNLAESFNARMRDLMRGTHHKTDNKYALHYANYAAYLSDNRRKSNRELFEDVLKRCLWVLSLKEWVGYWQGNHRQGELIGMKAFAPNEISSHYFKRLEEQAAYDEILMAA